MLGQSQAKQITDRVLALSKNGQAEVVLWVTDGALTRFANNVIHQNVAETNTGVTVRVALGQRVGVAETNDVTDDGLHAWSSVQRNLRGCSQRTRTFQVLLSLCHSRLRADSTKPPPL
jgi:predicted Zn-dependent protease